MSVRTGWTSWKVSRLLGIWTSPPLLPWGGPFRIDVFCTHSMCSSVQRRLRWPRELFRSSSLAKFMIIWVSRRYRQPGALAPFRKLHVSLPTSAVNAPSLAHICGVACVDSVAQRMLLSKTGSSRTRQLMKVYPTFTTILSLVTTTRCVSDFVCSLLSKVGNSRFCSTRNVSLETFCVSKKNLSLRLILNARRPRQHFRVPPKILPWQLGLLLACRTSCWESERG